MSVWTVLTKSSGTYEAHTLYSSFDRGPAWREAEQTYPGGVVAMWKGNFASEVMTADPNKSENKLPVL